VSAGAGARGAGVAPAWVTGTGVLCPGCDGSGAFAAALRAARAMPVLQEAPADDPGAAALLHAARGGATGRLAGWDDRRFTGAERRRLNRIGRLAVTAAGQALAEAGLDGAALAAPGRAERVGLCYGTGYGGAEDAVAFLDGVATRGAEYANPALFPSSVLNAAAAYVSLRFGILGYGATVTARDLSGELALVQAADALALGHADALLAGGVDESLPTLAAVLRRLRLLRGPGRPEGAVLGEGAAALVLEAPAAATARGAHPLAVLAGWASGGGAAPAPQRYAADAPATLVRVAREALAQAARDPADVDLVITGAAGLPELDTPLALSLAALFPAAAAPAVFAVRHVTGWFPSSGAHAAAAAVLALSGAFFPGAPAARGGPGTALVLSAGAGGACAALVFIAAA
jgi:3-oxoacyl-[acyl-carrier-protein] synthase II